ncbi:MAG: RdgB/HAM1 family non-canonical purine NTP pyrophosphatase [Candidatus Omnitrophota bacterium]|nr:RdgB/HAM1 family non-canonical purine NTP pyrophosphatase [Candidatus Omnitrophota bacterium]MBU1928564.1 RdgB/HAM1 family non-canonical purine NTP pyrophosphatase [Candidatus Omnitrophota bacterium]MBU2034577.1 RdgB/HAM1 family non-canonical purine NTP pyrophosphatase [Candidatus Omnitrophota bacterium]MBU2220992.1 RdgB/HAM1 family non-canonical purine NTP pyrophosphatase [Candidatus Omnitrophota bacterium]
MKELVIATQNKKKLEEIREILKGLDLKITSLVDYSFAPKIVENGVTFRDNAIKKALKISRFNGKLTLGEDSGLCINALGGKPGVYSARFSGKNKSDALNNQKVLKLLGNLPLSKRRAHYSCAVAIADAGKLIGSVECRCFGRIGFKPRGDYGFGYDPVFIIPKYKKTFAQLGPKIKHKMSHRYLALKKAEKIIAGYLKNKGQCYILKKAAKGGGYG